MLHDDVEDPAVALPGPGRRLLTVEARVDGSQGPIDSLCLLPGRDRQRVALHPPENGHHVSRGASAWRVESNAHSRSAVRTGTGANWVGWTRSSAMVAAVRVLAVFLRLLPPSSGQRAFTYSTANVYQVIEADLEWWDTGSPVAMTKASPFPVARMSSERKPSARVAVPKGSRQRLSATTQRTVYVVFRAPL